MPASPKHVERKEQDFYETPYWCTRVLLDSIQLRSSNLLPRILEPCAGNGAISKEIIRKYPDIQLQQVEIQKKMNQLSHFGDVTIADFLTSDVDKMLKIFDPQHIITNPPFSLAKEFLEKCFELFPFASVTMLLPLSFLGSDERHEFWLEHRPDALYILSDRPSFTGYGSDSSVYAWYRWNTKETGIFHLKNTYKTVYDRAKVIEMCEHGLAHMINTPEKIIRLNTPIKVDPEKKVKRVKDLTKLDYQTVYKRLIKDHGILEDIYRNL